MTTKHSSTEEICTDFCQNLLMPKTFLSIFFANEQTFDDQ